jgi:hypothetical protein
MLVNDVVKKIEKCMAAEKLSQIELARITGIPQSTLSRALSHPVRVTRTHRTICKTLGISIVHDEGSSGAETLRKAVLDAWDGTDRHAQALAALLRAAAHISAVTAATNRSF